VSVPQTSDCLIFTQAHAKLNKQITYRKSTTLEDASSTEVRCDFVSLGRRLGVLASPGLPGSSHILRHCSVGSELKGGLRA
jgi:hypothetical protein